MRAYSAVAKLRSSLLEIERSWRPTQENIEAELRALERAEQSLSWPRRPAASGVEEKLTALAEVVTRLAEGSAAKRPQQRPSRAKSGPKLSAVVGAVLNDPRYAATPYGKATLREIERRYGRSVSELTLKTQIRRRLAKKQLPE